MELLGKVRRMQVRDKLSERAIAKRTGLSRNTVHKWLQTPEEVEMPKYVRAKGFSKLGDFTGELEQSLKADALRPKKDRRTARALFAQLKASGYAGGYTRVTDYIRAWRANAGKDIKAFVPLKFDLGEAFQFDWSQEGMVVGGIYHRMQVSHMKLCASRAFWLVAYPSQGHEMLFDAHIGVDPEAPSITPARGPPLWEGEGAQETGEGVEAEPDWDLANQSPPDYPDDQRTAW